MTELSAAVDDQSIMFKGTLENQKIPSFSFRKKYQNFAKTTYNVWPPFKKVPVLEKKMKLLLGPGRESRVPQIVITATQICFAASALLNW